MSTEIYPNYPNHPNWPRFRRGGPISTRAYTIRLFVREGSCSSGGSC